MPGRSPREVITCVVLISGTKAFLSYIISKQHATKIYDLFLGLVWFSPVEAFGWCQTMSICGRVSGRPAAPLTLPFQGRCSAAERPESTIPVALMSCLVFPLTFVIESQSRDFSLSQRADARATESKWDFSARARRGALPGWACWARSPALKDRCSRDAEAPAWSVSRTHRFCHVALYPVGSCPWVT